MKEISEIRCRREAWRDSLEIALISRNGLAMYVAKTIEMHKVNDGDFIQPAIRLDAHVAQQLMDELWVCGLRPTEGTGSAGSLAATERHLTDVRKIVFGLLKTHGVES